MKRLAVSVRRMLATTLVLLAVGCARNAVLEAKLVLPALPISEPATYAYVQFERPPVGFGSTWAGSTDFDGVQLTEGAPTMRQFSVVTERVDGPLLVKIRFCSTPRCETAEPRRELWYEIDRPFYAGRRTRWRRIIADIPAAAPSAAEHVDRCQVGCVDVYPVTDPVSFCRADGTNFCEAPGGGGAADAASVDAAPLDATSRDASLETAVGAEP